MIENLLMTAVMAGTKPLIADAMPPIRGYSHSSMHGYSKSKYRGKYYVKTQEVFRKCVMHRESRNTYGADNMPVSTAAGAYQFLRAWHMPLTYMIRPELSKTIGPRNTRLVINKLRTNPIYRWNRYIQDMAFFTVLNYNGKYSGWKHWYGGGSPCNGLVGR